MTDAQWEPPAAPPAAGGLRSVRRGQRLDRDEIGTAPAFYVTAGVWLVESEVGAGRAASLLAKGDVLVGSATADLRRPVVLHALTDAEMLPFSPTLAARRSPELAAQLVLRLLEQQACDAELRCVSHISRADERVLELLRVLGGRFGRATDAGVLLPLGLLHRHLGLLIGARRPTITTALATLTQSGRVRLLGGGYEVLDMGERSARFA